MENNLKQKNKAFTLVETLVSISIFTTSILALLAILSGGIANTGYAKKKIIASYLAQEGIEYMRNMRDTFALYNAGGAQIGWEAFNTKVSGGIYPSGNSVCTQGGGNSSSNGCYFDNQNLNYSNNSQPMAGIDVIACGVSCSELKYYNVTGEYDYSFSGANSGYTRKIRVMQVNANESKIFSTVSWVQGSGTHSITLSESLFNWIE